MRLVDTAGNMTGASGQELGFIQHLSGWRSQGRFTVGPECFYRRCDDFYYGSCAGDAKLKLNEIGSSDSCSLYEKYELSTYITAMTNVFGDGTCLGREVKRGRDKPGTM